MSIYGQIRQYGFINQAVKQGRPVKDKDVTKKNQQVNVCLNCTKETCKGHCGEFKK